MATTTQWATAWECMAAYSLPSPPSTPTTNFLSPGNSRANYFRSPTTSRPSILRSGTSHVSSSSWRHSLMTSVQRSSSNRCVLSSFFAEILSWNWAHIFFQEIDGEALLLLDQSDLVRVLKLKLGPAVKIHNALTMLKRADEWRHHNNIDFLRTNVINQFCNNHGMSWTCIARVEMWCLWPWPCMRFTLSRSTSSSAQFVYMCSPSYPVVTVYVVFFLFSV